MNLNKNKKKIYSQNAFNESLESSDSEKIDNQMPNKENVATLIPKNGFKMKNKNISSAHFELYSYIRRLYS
jgi:hypothetical protein